MFHENNVRTDEKSAPLSILVIPPPPRAVNGQIFYVFPK